MLDTIKAIAFDLDGTIYHGNKIVEGVPELLEFLKRKNIKIFYLTNNSKNSRKEIYDKLSEMGLILNIKDIYNSTHATALYLMEHNIKNVYCLGSEGLIKELTDNHINITDKLAEALIIGLHHNFDYVKLTKAINIVIKNKCKIIACNRDKTYPVEDNKLMPGCGAIVAAVEEATARKIDFLVGKPHTYMIELLAKDWNLKNKEIMVIGDSIETDIEMAGRYDCPSVLITEDKKLNVKKTIKISNILQIKKYL